jgi:hypothetical protein
MPLPELQIVFAQAATKAAERNAGNRHDANEKNAKKNAGWRCPADPQAEHNAARDSARDAADYSDHDGIRLVWNVNNPRCDHGQNRRDEEEK